MAVDWQEQRRRHTLKWLVGGMSAVGTVAVLTPFVETMQPSEAAKAAGAPVEVDLSHLVPGELLTIAWRGRPVWILHRTPAMQSAISGHDGALADPQSQRSEQPAYAKNEFRSIKPDFLVLVGVCTHLGCTPVFRPQPGAADIAPDWPGGFYCPCHGSRFDLAGRVFKNVPAPDNLAVPPHAFLSASRLLVGQEKV